MVSSQVVQDSSSKENLSGGKSTLGDARPFELIEESVGENTEISTRYRSLVSKTRLVTFWISAFALVNLILFKIFANQGYFTEVDEISGAAYGYVNASLTAFFIVALCGQLGSEAFAGVRTLRIPYQLNLFLATLLLGGYTLFQAFDHTFSLVETSLVESFILFSFLVSLFLVLRDRTLNKIKKYGDFKVVDQISEARIIKPENSFSAPVTSSVTGGSIVGQGELFPRQVALSVPPTSLRAGDIIQVSAGEVVPTDGVIVDGTALVKERRLSALLNDRLRTKGDDVFTGSKIVLGNLEIKVGLPITESLASSLDPILEQSLTADLRAEVRIDYYTSLINLSLIFLSIIAGQAAYMFEQSLFEISLVIASVLTLSLLTIPLTFQNLRERVFVAASFARGILFRSVEFTKRLSSLKTVAFAADPSSLANDNAVSGFFVMDARVDRKELGSILLALSLKADHGVFRDLSRYLLNKEKVTPKLIEVAHFLEYPGMGLCGNISGAELTIGFEDFLIDRGVYLQSTEAIAHGNRVLYVAVGEEVIARLPLVESTQAFKEKLLKSVQGLGIRTILMSQDSQALADNLGKNLGFDLGDIFGSLDNKGMTTKADSIGLSLFITDHASISKSKLTNSLTVTYFDHLKQELGEGDIVLFSYDSTMISLLGKLGRRIKNLSIERRLIVGTVAILIIGLFISGSFSPVWPLAGAILLTTSLFMESARITKLLTPP